MLTGEPRFVMVEFAQYATYYSLLCDEDCNVLQCEVYCATSADLGVVVSLRRAFGVSCVGRVLPWWKILWWKNFAELVKP